MSYLLGRAAGEAEAAGGHTRQVRRHVCQVGLPFQQPREQGPEECRGLAQREDAIADVDLELVLQCPRQALCQAAVAQPPRAEGRGGGESVFVGG